MHLAELVTVACTPLTCFLYPHLSSTHHTHHSALSSMHPLPFICLPLNIGMLPSVHLSKKENTYYSLEFNFCSSFVTIVWSIHSDSLHRYCDSFHPFFILDREGSSNNGNEKKVLVFFLKTHGSPFWRCPWLLLNSHEELHSVSLHEHFNGWQGQDRI